MTEKIRVTNFIILGVVWSIKTSKSLKMKENSEGVWSMISFLKTLSIILMFLPAILIYKETTSILIAVLPLVAGALLYTYIKSQKHTQNHRN